MFLIAVASIIVLTSMNCTENMLQFIAQTVERSQTLLNDQEEVKSSCSFSKNQKENHNEDWFDAHIWERSPHTEHCFYVENICHSKYEWFYDEEEAEKDFNPYNDGKEQWRSRRQPILP